MLIKNLTQVYINTVLELKASELKFVFNLDNPKAQSSLSLFPKKKISIFIFIPILSISHCDLWRLVQQVAPIPPLNPLILVLMIFFALLKTTVNRTLQTVALAIPFPLPILARFVVELLVLSSLSLVSYCGLWMLEPNFRFFILMCD